VNSARRAAMDGSRIDVGSPILSACRIAAMLAIERIRRVVEDLPHVRLAVAFGSAVDGTARPDSDLDLGVSLADGHGEVLAVLAVEIERAIGRPVDLVSLDDAPPLLRFEIARDGLLLVERVPQAWTDFRARAMIDWWDWAPTARMMHSVMAERVRQEAARGPA